jgi:hypothetical protein
LRNASKAALAPGPAPSSRAPYRSANPGSGSTWWRHHTISPNYPAAALSSVIAGPGIEPSTPGAGAAVLAARAIGGSGGGHTMQPADARCRRLAQLRRFEHFKAPKCLRLLRLTPEGRHYSGIGGTGPAVILGGG